MRLPIERDSQRQFVFSFPQKRLLLTTRLPKLLLFLAATDSLSAQASSKPVAKRSSLPVSNVRECSGPCWAPTPSSLYAAVTATVALRSTGRAAGRLNLHFYVAHPWIGVDEHAQPLIAGFARWCIDAYSVTHDPQSPAPPAHVQRVFERHQGSNSTGQQLQPLRNGALGSAPGVPGPYYLNQCYCQPRKPCPIQSVRSSPNRGASTYQTSHRREAGRFGSSLQADPQRSSNPCFIYVFVAVVCFRR